MQSNEINIGLVR